MGCSMSPSKLTSEVWPIADAGQTPADREDTVLVYQPSDPTELHYSGSLYVIASGLSSGERGELAGRYAAQKVMNAYFSSDEPDLGLRLREALEAANADLYAYTQQRPELVKVGVIVTTAAIRGELMHVAQVGDSRAYLIRDGRIRQVTRDHTLVQQLLDEGAIAPDEAPDHPRRDVLLRTLGTQETVAIDIYDTRLRPDDAVVLCSNVLPRALTDDEIVQVAASKAPRNAAEMLVQKARGQGVKQSMAVIAALLRDGAPPLAADIPYAWDGQPPSFDSQPTLMMKRVSRQEQPPASPEPQPPADVPQAPAVDRTSPAAQTHQRARQAPEPTPVPPSQPAPPYQTPVQPAPQYGAQQPAPPPHQQQPAYPAHSQSTQQQYTPSGYIVDPVTGLPPVPQGQAGWGAPPGGGYAPRIYQPPGQPQYRQPRRGFSIGMFALAGLLAVLLTAAMILILVNPFEWKLPWAGEVAQAPTATPTTVTLPTLTPQLATTQPPDVQPTMPPVTATQSAPSDMVLIEGGAFLRGVPDTEIEAILPSCYDEDTRPENPGCLPDYFNDAQPVEEVTISPFYIDMTEVTNKAYAACVAAGVCTQPAMLEFYSDPNYADHPVVYVNWDQATAYCQWAGKRLPREAEWEKAARWDPRSSQSYVYPWGNTFEAGRANTRVAGRGGTSPVTEFAQDISPWGVLGMAGNVSEWVSDWYFKGYNGLGTLNPTGPPNQPLAEPFRVGRGGSFQSMASYARAGQRLDVPPATVQAWLGFRCVADAAGAVPAMTPTLAETPGGTTITPTTTAATPVP